MAFVLFAIVAWQLAADGAFPLELKRTKPDGYSLFKLDAFATLREVLRPPAANQWAYQLPAGRGMARGASCLAPCVADKRHCPLSPDGRCCADWPVAPPSLVLGVARLDYAGRLRTWQRLPALPVPEVRCNLLVRNSISWLC